MKKAKKQKCKCLAISCTENCKRSHTHKTYYCEHCQPVPQKEEWKICQCCNGKKHFISTEAGVYEAICDVLDISPIAPLDKRCVNTIRNGLAEERAAERKRVMERLKLLRDECDDAACSMCSICFEKLNNES